MMLLKLPFEVIEIARFISDIRQPYMTYFPTTYSLHEEEVGVGRMQGSLLVASILRELRHLEYTFCSREIPPFQFAQNG